MRPFANGNLVKTLIQDKRNMDEKMDGRTEEMWTRAVAPMNSLRLIVRGSPQVDWREPQCRA